MNNFIYSEIVKSSDISLYIAGGILGLFLLTAVIIMATSRFQQGTAFIIVMIAAFYAVVGTFAVMITSSISSSKDLSKDNNALVSAIQKSYDVKYMEADNNLVSRGQYTLQFKDGSLHMCTTDYLKNDKPHYQKVALLCDNNKNFIRPVSND